MGMVLMVATVLPASKFNFLGGDHKFCPPDCIQMQILKIQSGFRDFCKFYAGQPADIVGFPRLRLAHANQI